MTFSVLICTRNSANKIREVIHSIKEQTAKNDVIEVLIVDYESSDDTLRVVEDELMKHNINHHVFLINKSGKSAAIEYGLDKAIGDYALILDDDNILFPDFIHNAKIILQKKSRIGCLGSQGIADETLQYPEWFDKYQSVFAIGLPSQAGKTDWVWGAASIIKLQAWRLLRARDFVFQLSPERKSHMAPIALGGEDVELSLAIKLLGYEVDFSSDLKFIHKFEQKRLNADYLVNNNRGVVRSVAVHDIYRTFIYKKDNIFSYYMIWQWYFWKKVLFSIIRTVLSYILFYPKLDRQMNYATFVGLLSGYKYFFAKMPGIIRRIKRLILVKASPLGL